MAKIGGFQFFKTARRIIAGLEAMLWLQKGFGFTATGPSTIKTICSRASPDIKRSTRHKCCVVIGSLSPIASFATRPFRIMATLRYIGSKIFNVVANS